MPGLVQLVVAALYDAVGLLHDFAGAEEEAECLFQPEGVVFVKSSHVFAISSAIPLFLSLSFNCH